MFFSDIHTHLLYGADDGARTYDDMVKMADMAYSEGIRLICATPHCCPDDFGDNRLSSEKAFSELQNYCAEKYPDMRLFLGNELFCDLDGIQWLKKGFCRTMGDTRYVLCEFPVAETENNISKALLVLLGSGYVPIIAHAERYHKLGIKRIADLKNNGIMVQVNTRSSFKGADFCEKRRLKALLSEKIADFVSTDAHDLNERSPEIKNFYEIVSRKYGENYAVSIFCSNALRILTEEEQYGKE